MTITCSAINTEIARLLKEQEPFLISCSNDWPVISDYNNADQIASYCNYKAFHIDPVLINLKAKLVEYLKPYNSTDYIHIDLTICAKGCRIPDARASIIESATFDFYLANESKVCIETRCRSNIAFGTVSFYSGILLESNKE